MSVAAAVVLPLAAKSQGDAFDRGASQCDDHPPQHGTCRTANFSPQELQGSFLPSSAHQGRSVCIIFCCPAADDAGGGDTVGVLALGDISEAHSWCL